MSQPDDGSIIAKKKSARQWEEQNSSAPNKRSCISTSERDKRLGNTKSCDGNASEDSDLFADGNDDIIRKVATRRKSTRRQLDPARFDPSCPNNSTFMKSAKGDKNDGYVQGNTRNVDGNASEDSDLFADGNNNVSHKVATRRKSARRLLDPPARFNPSCPNNSTFMNSTKGDKNKSVQESTNTKSINGNNSDDSDLFGDESEEDVTNLNIVAPTAVASNKPAWGANKPTWGGNQPSWGTNKPAWGGNQPTWGGNQPSWGGNKPSPWGENEAGRSPTSVAEFRNTSPSSVEYRSPVKYKGKKCAPKGVIRSKNDIVVVRSCEDEFMLRHLFDGLLHILEIPVSSKAPNLEKTLEINDCSCVLVASKYISTNDTPQGKHYVGNKLSCAHVKAFYVSAKLSDVKNKLNSFANFAELGLNPGKLASRIELLISPALKDGRKGGYPYFIESELSKFRVDESIEDNQSEGCGFIPKHMLEEFVGVGSAKAMNSFAMQVRVYSANLGIFKGLLEIKDGIDKIVLTNAMRKVGKALRCRTDKSVYLVIKSIYPSTNNKKFEKMFNPNMQSLTKKESQESLQGTLLMILNGCGISPDVLDSYSKRARVWETLAHSYLVGLCDNTDGGIPEGCVFLTGCPWGFGRSERKIMLTRIPVTSPDDIHVLPVITSKPKNMSESKWKSICDFAFGGIMFGSPSEKDAESLPQRVNNSDLDGDKFCGIWDEELISHFENWKLKCKEAPLPRPLAVTESHGIQILKHRYPKKGVVEVQIEEGNKVTWTNARSLSTPRNEVVQYAIDEELQEEPGWSWVKYDQEEVEIIEIRQHRCRWNKGKNGALKELLEVEVRYAGEIETEWKDAKTIDVDLMIKYTNEKKIKLTGRDWKWLSLELKDEQRKWFENAQDCMANVQHMSHHDNLVKKLHGLWKANYTTNGGCSSQDAKDFGNAFKEAIDVGKHGGKVEIPLRLRDEVAPTSQTPANDFLRVKEEFGAEL